MDGCIGCIQYPVVYGRTQDGQPSPGYHDITKHSMFIDSSCKLTSHYMSKYCYIDVKYLGDGHGDDVRS